MRFQRRYHQAFFRFNVNSRSTPFVTAGQHVLETSQKANIDNVLGATAAELEIYLHLKIVRYEYYNETLKRSQLGLKIWSGDGIRPIVNQVFGLNESERRERLVVNTKVKADIKAANAAHYLPTK